MVMMLAVIGVIMIKNLTANQVLKIYLINYYRNGNYIVYYSFFKKIVTC